MLAGRIQAPAATEIKAPLAAPRRRAGKTVRAGTDGPKCFPAVQDVKSASVKGDRLDASGEGASGEANPHQREAKSAPPR